MSDAQGDDSQRGRPETARQVPVRPPVAPFSRHGDLLVTSGQTAVGPDGTLFAKGTVGDTIGLDLARRCAVQCMRNIFDVIEGALSGSTDEVAALLELRVFVASTSDFTDHHLVADAATEHALHRLGPRVGLHSRTTLGVAGLPGGSPVEVQATLVLAPQA